MTKFFDRIEVYNPFGVMSQNHTIPNWAGYGIPDSMCSPERTNRITQSDMNGIFYYATLASALLNCGYQPQPIWEVSDKRMYPRGAILTVLTEDNQVQELVNLQDKNGCYTYSESGYPAGWQPVWNYQNFNFFPDFDDKKLILSREIDNQTATVEVPYSNGWVLVERTFTNYDAIKNHQYDRDYVMINPKQVASDSDVGIRIISLEGETSSRIIPITSHKSSFKIVCSSSFSPIQLNIYAFTKEEYEISNADTNDA